jgi:hypothetical protein
MSRRHARSLFAVGAAVVAVMLGVVAVMLGAGAALAATTWTVHPGGSVSITSANLLFRDVKTRSTIMCTSTVASGSFKSGSGLSGTRIGSLTAISFSNCTNPLGVRVRFSLTATGLPWHVNANSYNAANGIVTGGVNHIHINVVSPGCSTMMDGTGATASDGIIKFAYSNSTGKLRPHTIRRDLHFYSVTGCAGLFITGDPINVTATFIVSPKQAITSP